MSGARGKKGAGGGGSGAASAAAAAAAGSHKAHQPANASVSSPPSATAETAPSATTAPSSSAITPISSPHDPHVYRHVTLPNGLCALLIVDAPRTAVQRARDEARKKKSAKKATTAESPDDSAAQADDDESKPAVVALSVRVGSWSDPAAVPGLAHFCEHMLFMGNKAYPGENEWEEFLSDHGGSSNAFTDAEQTVYYFEVNPLHLHAALQRFAHFFKTPLFAPSATKREIRAVDSEFRDCYSSDSERISELLNSTAAEANPSHPFCKWGWGSKESLETNLRPKKAAPEPKQKHQAKGKKVAPAAASATVAPTVDLRAELKAFHARYYSAHAMKLVVYQAGGKLDKLERWVHNEFEAIVNNGLPLNNFAHHGHPFLPPPPHTATSAAAPASNKGAQASKESAMGAPVSPLTSCLQRMYYIVPIKEIYKLNVSWVITPSLAPAYAKKPLHYAEHLLGHESEGSLYSLLRNKGWVTSLVAGVNEAGNFKNTAFECMQLSLDMTKEGSRFVDDVLDFVFQYLSLIRQPANVQESIYRELQQLSEIGFLFSEQQDPSDLVQDHAVNLHIYPPHDTVRGDFLHEAFDRELTVSVLERLSVANCRIDLAVPSNKDRPNLQKAPWFHTHYTSEPVDPATLARWSRYDQHPELIDPAMHLPAPNAFVPTDFAINVHATPEDARRQADNHGPVLLSETKLGQYWYQLDETFKLPRAYVHILLETPAVYASALSVAQSELLIKLWVDSVNEYAYQASLAELEFSIESLRSGVELKLSGFHHKLVRFVEAIVRGLADLETFLHRPDAQLRFESMKEKTYRHFKHRFFVPLKQANHARLTVLQQHKFAIEDITAACKQITSDQLLDHLRHLLSTVRITGLVDGNISKAEAAAMFANIEATVASRSTPAPPRQELSLCLPAGHCIYLDQRARNPRETNHAIEVYWQIGRASLFTRGILNLLELLIAEPAFDQLRTKEQLGYKVQSGVRNTHGVLGFVICIQSAAYDPHHLASRVESFLFNTFYALLLGMPADKFETSRASLVAEFNYEDTHLGERVDRNWDEVSETRSYCFNRPALMAKQVATVTHAQVLHFFEHHFLGITSQPPQPPEVEETATPMTDDTPTAPAPSVSPVPDEATSTAVAVSAIQLNPAEEEEKRKLERKLAKKQRLAEAKAAAAASKAQASVKKDAVAEAAVASKVAAAKLQPVLYRRQVAVCIFGHAHKKKDKETAKDSKSDEDEEMEDDDDEEDEHDEDDSEDGEDEEDGSEEEEEEDGTEEGEGNGSDSDDEVDPAALDTLWLTPAEWQLRLESQKAKEAENANIAAVQPPTKKQKNGRHTQTPKHAAVAASTASLASSAPATAALFAAFPTPPPLQVQLRDGISTNCACVTGASPSPSQPVTTGSQLEHAVRLRTFEALEAFKAATPLMPFVNGPEPDLPASAIARRA